MSQFNDRNAYSGNLVTKFDPSVYAQSTSIDKRSTFISTSTQQSSKAAAEIHKSRQEKILEVLGVPPPKRTASNTPQPPPPPKPSSANRSAVSASQDAAFPCSFQDCQQGFVTAKDLRRHKHREHDYCRVCDLDFEDDNAYHQHKIHSEKHICCTVCSLDFRSESGRDRHYITTHSAAHNVKCKRCEVVFTKGAGLVRHFEKNDCKPKDQQGISSEQFEVQRAETAMVMQNRIKIADEYGELAYLRSQTQGPSFGGSIAQSSVVGGVPIAPSEQPDLLNEDADIPASSRPTNQEQRSSPAASEATTDLLGLKSENNYSALNATNLAALNKVTKEIDRTPKATIAEWPVVGKDKEGLVEGMSNVNLGGNMAFPVPMMPDLSVAPPSVQPSRSGFSDVGDASNAIELQPNQFTGLWECPFYKCRYRCNFRQDLEAHMNDRDNGHHGYENNCPACLKRFKTPSALTAHLESPTVRCKIRESRTFSNVLHVVSGGHLAAHGRHGDGTMRLVVQEDAGESPKFIW